MKKTKTDYRTIWKLALELTQEEQLTLVEALIDHLYGFGMWKDRKEMEDIQSYVEAIRKEDSYHSDGRKKTPTEFLQEVKEWNG